MFRIATAAVALIGILHSTTGSFAADLLGDERYYDRSYYDGPYQPEYAIPVPRAGINGGKTLLPPSYAQPETRWSCERPPYGTGDLRPLTDPYRWAPPSYQPSYAQPEYRRPYAQPGYRRPYGQPGYRRPYGQPNDGWGNNIPIPQVGIYERAPTPPDTYARPDNRRSYDRYANCGVNRYWDGQRCVDVRFEPRYRGRRL